MKRVFTALLGAATCAAAILTTGLGDVEAQSSHAMVSMASSSTKAAGLRTALNTLFQEHIYLASAATGAALGSRDAEFKAAAAALDANSVAISKAIGSVYG